MTKFEEFERDLGSAVEGILPGAKCAKITVTFVDSDGAKCSLGILRKGFADPDARADDDAEPGDEE